MTSTRVVSVGDKTLKHGLEAFVAPTANVVGAVTLGERASVWYGATVRGTIAPTTCRRLCASGRR